jgi:hypothetical protein
VISRIFGAWIDEQAMTIFIARVGVTLCIAVATRAGKQMIAPLKSA